jgi:hypothetical protein
MRQPMDTAQAHADQRAQQSGEPFEVDAGLRDMLLDIKSEAGAAVNPAAR